MMTKTNKLFVLTSVLILSLVTISVAWAGGSLDFGTLLGTPAQANYVAWMGNAGTPPSQVLTEDGFNSATGPDQGYQGGSWLLNAGNFNNPAAADGQNLSFVFGGLGAASGTLWQYTVVYDIDAPTTDHGEVTTTSAGQCPVMTQGSQDGTGKTINWTGASSQHLIYRSQQESGAANGYSNGRYEFVDSVSAGTFTYLDTACTAGTDCWHIVVPADGSGNINGCHSEESNPTAIELSGFAASTSENSSLVLFLAILAAIFAPVMLLRKLRLQK